MKKIKKTILLIAMIVTFSTIIFAQENNTPYERKIENAGEYNIEIVIREGKAYFYLLDSKLTFFSNEGITGSVYLQYQEGKTKTIELLMSGKDSFTLPTFTSINYINVIVTFKVDGKMVFAKFKNKPEEEPEVKPNPAKGCEGHQH